MDNNVKDESTYIFEKRYTCPICNKEFKSKQVKTGKSHFMGTEEDLRPIYTGIDTIKYDVVMCPHCGYASVLREFNNISARHRKNIQTEICDKYKGVEEECDVYSYDTAIRRYKMALLTAMVKPAKLSERAYLCLKLSWLYRGAANELEEQGADADNETLKQYKQDEENFTKQAYSGFTEAISQEYPPICNMDEMTLNYLLAVLAYKCEDYISAQRFAYLITGSKSAGTSVKRKTTDLLEKIRAAGEKK